MSATDEPEIADISLRNLDVATLLSVILRRKWVVASVGFATLILAVGYLHFATYLFTAELQVAPIVSSGSVGDKLRGLTDLAEAAGDSVPGDLGSMQFRLYIEGIHTRAVADALAQRADIMKIVFKEEWDEKLHRWVQPPPGLIGSLSLFVKFVLGLPSYPWEPPDGARLQTYLDSAVVVERNSKDVLATISYKNQNPQFAELLLKALHDADDEHLRRKELARSAQYIKYLSDKLPTVTNADHRQAIAQILSDQEKSMMMARAQLSFAADPFGPPSASFRPTSPKPLLILPGALMIGVLIGMIFAVFIELGIVPSLDRLRSTAGFLPKTRARYLWKRGT